MAKTCCHLECLKTLSYNDVNETRNRFLMLDKRIDERNFILSYLKYHTSCRKSNQSIDSMTTFLVKGKPVCKQAWLLTNSISGRRFSSIFCDFRKGSELYQHGNRGTTRYARTTSACLAWINFLVNAIGDQQPDSGKVHLPSCFSKLSLYRKMCQELSEDVHVSRSQFYRIMDTHLNHVVIPKV